MTKQELGDLSVREKNLWIELVVDVAVGLYYWPKAISLMMAGDAALRGAAMVGLITGTVIWAIIVSSVLAIFLHRRGKPEPKDERDYMIDARGSMLAGRVLIGCLMVIMGLAVLHDMGATYSYAAPFLAFIPLGFSPLIMAHLLLVALMLHSLTRSVARLYFYRQGL